jgi:hypothetical protein
LKRVTAGIVQLGAELHARHVLDADLGTVRVGADDHVAEFLGSAEAALGAHRISETGSGRGRRAADLAGWRDHILFLNGAGDVRHRQSELGELIRFYPDAHGILAAAQHARLTNAPDAGDGVEDIDGQVIAEEILVIGRIG